MPFLSPNHIKAIKELGIERVQACTR